MNYTAPAGSRGRAPALFVAIALASFLAERLASIETRMDDIEKRLLALEKGELK